MNNRNKRAAIVLNAPVLTAEITEKDIICADGGVNLAVGGFIPKFVVGDFDSATTEIIGAEKETCPQIKDYTDGERAVVFAKEKGYEEIVIYGTDGGRCDHVFANYSLLAFAKGLGLKAIAKTADGYFFYADEKDGRVELNEPVGTTVSVLPFDGDVTLDDSTGLFYPYRNIIITRARADTGISNVTTKRNVSFEIKQGGALIFVNDNV